MGNDKKPDEFEIIARYFAPLAAGEPGALGLLDDAALLNPPPGRQLVVTTDSLSAGVHFPADEAASDIAARLIGVNLSDLAAMGAEPWAYTLSLALPEDWQHEFIEPFAEELGRQQKHHSIHLVGGDTVATKGPLTLTLTAIGTVADGQALRRNGAQSGDDVYVSGSIGDAALGLKVLKGELTGLPASLAEHLLARYHRPQPRVRLGARLFGIASAAIDISDGLVADLGHIARASGGGALLYVDRVPYSAAALAAIALDPALVEAAIIGGDDYELLFTAPASLAGRIEDLSLEIDLALTRIGSINNGNVDNAEPVRVADGNGGELSIKTGGYRHF
ncbi:MAG: thiamine-phosphate kinase [Proteobacteria bacterium]|nr:thiamine-phosphate kinase [Pseudomonadota bacterium]